MKKLFLSTLAIIATVGLVLHYSGSTYAGHNGAVVDVDGPAACGETTISASIADPDGTHVVDNMQLVVDVDGDAQHDFVPVDGTSVSFTVGPFFTATPETKTISWRIFGGAERDYDDPLWNGYGDSDFSSDIADYGDENGFDWVVAGTDDPNPFTTWYETDVESCVLEEVASFNGGGHLLEDVGAKRKDWHDVSFGGNATLFNDGSATGELQVNLHNVGDDDLDKSKFHGSDVVEMNLFDGDSATCHSALNMTLNGTFDGESGYSMIFRAGDNSSPNTEDTARVTIYDGEDATGSVVYDTHTAGEFSDESSCVGSARTGLDTGNLTIKR